MTKLRLCSSLLSRPVARLPRRQARAQVAIVHARKASGDFGQYSDYYSSEEARELSKIMPTDPNSLFDDSMPPSPAELGMYASGAGAASAAAANRLFGGDLHSSLDESLYSDAYSEEFNSFRDPGPDAGPWFSQQSPINSGLSLDEDIEALSDEAKAYRDWEHEKALNKALEISSYQLTHTVNRYMISMEHSALMEEIEAEDAHRLDPAPAMAGGVPLPSWIRAVYKLQEDFDALNEQQAWAEEQFSLEEQQRFERDIEEMADRGARLSMLDQRIAAPPETIQLVGDDDSLVTLGEAAADAGGSLLDALMGGVALQQEARTAEDSEEGFDKLFWPANFLPGVGPLDAIPDLGEGSAAAAADGGTYMDPLGRLPGLAAGLGSEGPAAAALPPRGGGGYADAAGGGEGIQLTPQQALQDMDAEFERREAAWDDMGPADDDLGPGGAAAAAAAAAWAAQPYGGAGMAPGVDATFDGGDELRPYSGAAAGRYGGRYAAPYGGGELDDELGMWWGNSSEEEGEDEEEGALAQAVEQMLDAGGGVGLDELLLGEDDEGIPVGDNDSEDDDPNFSRSDLWQLRQIEQELEGRRRRGTQFGDE